MTKKQKGFRVRKTNLTCTLEDVHAMSKGERRIYFGKLLPADFDELTVPCRGEAHSNPHIDSCMTCLHVTWGCMLKSLDSKQD